jgi:hypothetical protein
MNIPMEAEVLQTQTNSHKNTLTHANTKRHKKPAVIDTYAGKHTWSDTHRHT